MPRSVWVAVGGATIGDPLSDGTFTVNTTGTFWPGITTAPAGLGCDYRFTGQAMVVSGAGFGFVDRASVNNGVPSGHGIQYDLGAGGYRDVEYPDESETGQVIAAQLDNAWHTVTVDVTGSHYTSAVDGHVIFTGTTASTCGGLYIRLWRTDAKFRDLTVTPVN